jgi:hypothetical protein
MAGLAKLTIPTSVAVFNYEYTFGNFVSTNAFTTTNIFATNVYVIGNLFDTGNVTPGYTTLSITGNVAVSNALTVPSLYANTLSLSNVGSTITLTGNVNVPSNAFTTANVFASGNMVVNGVTNPGVTRVALGDNLFVANAIATTNVFTGNLTATGNFTVGGLSGITSLNVRGNTAVSNAVTTNNVFVGNVLATGNMTIGGLPRLTILSVTGNAYVSNAVTASNIYALGNFVIGGASTLGATTLYGRSNLVVSNTVSTTNVWTTNVYMTGNARVDGLPTLTSAIITGNVLVGNTVTTTNVWTNNVMATGQMSFAGLPGFTSVSILGNALVGNALTTTNVWTNNVIATGNMTLMGLMGLTTARITGNAVVANAFTTNNVFAGNVFATGNLIVTGERTTGILTANVNGNVFASSAFQVTNVFATTISSNLVYLTGNVFVSNAVQSQNIWAGNVYAASVFIKNTSLYADPTTKSIGASVWTSTQAGTLTRAAHVPLYVESAGVAPSAGTIWSGDMYYDNSTLYKYMGASPLWCPIAPINLAAPSLTAIGTQNITTSATTAIQVSQTVDATSVGPVYWSLSGQPPDVFLSNTSSKGATIIVPAFMRGSSTSTVAVTATNSRGTPSQQLFSLGITMPTILLGTTRDYPVSNASVLRQFTSTDGNYWYLPLNTDTQPTQLYTNFTNATAGMGLVLIARGRESTDWWNSGGQNYSSTSTTLTSAALNTNTPIAVLSDRFVNSLIGNWRNMRMVVNRTTNGLNDSLYYVGTSDGPFSWNYFRSGSGTNVVDAFNPSTRVRTNVYRYTGTFRTGSLTAQTGDTQNWIDWYPTGANDCTRIFTATWSGHGGSWQGWSSGASCTSGYTATGNGHTLQLVHCYMEC